MLYIASIDCGRRNTKCVADGIRDWFQSGVAPWRELLNDRKMGRNDLTVEYQGDKYFVGDIAIDEARGGAQMMMQSKAHFDTKLLTLTALHRMLPNKASIFLMTGAPIAQRNEAEKMRLKKLLLGTHEITVNGEAKRFDIVRVEVGPECARATWSLRKPGIYTGVDIGSRTINFATIRDGMWWDAMSGTLDYGAESMGDISKSQFTRMMMADLSRYLRTFHPMVLMGQSAEAYLGYVQQYNPDTELHPDAFFANAMALYDLGVATLEKAKRA